jgi:hypothetical protein
MKMDTFFTFVAVSEITHIKRKRCYRYIFQLAYSTIHHGLLNTVAVKKKV